MKTTFLSWLCLVAFCATSMAHPAPKDSASATTLYLSLNCENAAEHTFNLYLNGHPITPIQNGDRLTYTIAYTTGPITLSDKGHKPFYTITPRPGASYCLEITKSFAGRYFAITDHSAPEKQEAYMRFIFWNRHIEGISGTHGKIIDKPTPDYRSTITLQESADHPLYP